MELGSQKSPFRALRICVQPLGTKLPCFARTLANLKLTRLLRIAALVVALGALVFIFIAITIAMHYGDGKILVDFNSRKEGWLELILTAFALSVILIHTLEYISTSQI